MGTELEVTSSTHTVGFRLHLGTGRKVNTDGTAFFLQRFNVLLLRDGPLVPPDACQLRGLNPQNGRYKLPSI